MFLFVCCHCLGPRDVASLGFFMSFSELFYLLALDTAKLQYNLKKTTHYFQKNGVIAVIIL